MSKNHRSNHGVITVCAAGGKREGAGRKPDWFKRKCAELAGSPKFFAFAKKVFDGEDVEPRIANGAVVHTEASVGDKVYLWEKLAAYGYGKPASIPDINPLVAPLQNVINETQILKLLYELNFSDRAGKGTKHPSVVESGVTPIQASAETA